MGARRISKNQRDIEKLLRASGLPYRIDSGQKHRKLYICEKMALVFSHGAHNSNDLQHIMSLIHQMIGKNANPRRTIQGA